MNFQENVHKDTVLFSLFHTTGCMALTSFIDSVAFDHLGKIVSAKILHHRVATFPFIMDKDLVETCKSNFHPLVLAFTDNFKTIILPIVISSMHKEEQSAHIYLYQSGHVDSLFYSVG